MAVRCRSSCLRRKPHPQVSSLWPVAAVHMKHAEHVEQKEWPGGGGRRVDNRMVALGRAAKRPSEQGEDARCVHACPLSRLLCAWGTRSGRSGEHEEWAGELTCWHTSLQGGAASAPAREHAHYLPALPGKPHVQLLQAVHASQTVTVGQARCVEHVCWVGRVGREGAGSGGSTCRWKRRAAPARGRCTVLACLCSGLRPHPFTTLLLRLSHL